jgi:hypothetical protein
MTKEIESSEKAMDALCTKSAAIFSKLDIEKGKPTPLSGTPPPVDVNKLLRLTSSVEAQSPTKAVNFAEFANENFYSHGSLTGKGKLQKADKAKRLYNEVQRTSINFGVTPLDMKSYHQRKRCGATTLTPISSHEFESILVTPPQSPKRADMTPSKPSERLLKDANVTSSLPTSQVTPIKLKLDLDEATDASEMKNRVLTEPFNSSQRRQDVLSPMPDTTEECHEVEDSAMLKDKLAKTSGVVPISTRQNKELFPVPVQERDDSPQLLTPSRLGSLFGKKSMNSLSSNPSRKECHSVEDTLDADEEFKDFSVPMSCTSYYPNRLEFSFESPASKKSSWSSLISPQGKMRDSSKLSNSSQRSLSPSIRSHREGSSSPSLLNEHSWRHRSLRAYEQSSLRSGSGTPRTSARDDVITEDDIIAEYI